MSYRSPDVHASWFEWYVFDQAIATHTAAAIPLQLLLGYLPPDPSEWDEVLARKRTEYLLFCEVGVVVHECLSDSSTSIQQLCI